MSSSRTIGILVGVWVSIVSVYLVVSLALAHHPEALATFGNLVRSGLGQQRPHALHQVAGGWEGLWVVCQRQRDDQVHAHNGHPDSHQNADCAGRGHTFTCSYSRGESPSQVSGEVQLWRKHNEKNRRARSYAKSPTPHGHHLAVRADSPYWAGGGGG